MHFWFVFFWSGAVLCCLFSVISSSLFFYDKSCLMFIFSPHGYRSLKSFSELSMEPRRSRHWAAGAALPLSTEPCSNRAPLMMKQNKREAASIKHKANAKIKAELSKTQLERVQFKESSRCFFFFFFSYLVVFRCWVKPQVTRVSIQTDRSQNFTSSVLIPGFSQSYYISHTFFLSFQITFTDKGTHFPLYHSSRSFLGVRWIFCISALLSSSWWPPRVIFLFSFWKLI